MVVLHAGTDAPCSHTKSLWKVLISGSVAFILHIHPISSNSVPKSALKKAQNSSVVI